MAAATGAPLRVLISGAAGQIGYSMIPLVMSGSIFGENTPIHLHLLDIPQAQKALNGVVMEIQDMIPSRVRSITATVDVPEAFKDVQVAILVGGFPRLKGMERKDLLMKNSQIFITQGEALAKYAHKDVKVLVVANPANSNCLVAVQNASGLPKKNFTCLTRLDQNRATYQLAKQLNVSTTAIRNVIIWGNHSSTLFPDYDHAFHTTTTTGGKTDTEQKTVQPIFKLDKAADLLTDKWRESFVTTVQQRGAAVIEARGFSSAMSAAQAIGDHLRDWIVGTPTGEYVSMGVVSDGTAYGVSADLVFSFPCQCTGQGNYTIIKDLSLSEYAKAMIKKTEAELLEEKSMLRQIVDAAGVAATAAATAGTCSATTTTKA